MTHRCRWVTGGSGDQDVPTAEYLVGGRVASVSVVDGMLGGLVGRHRIQCDGCRCALFDCNCETMLDCDHVGGGRLGRDPRLMADWLAEGVPTWTDEGRRPRGLRPRVMSCGIWSVRMWNIVSAASQSGSTVVGLGRISCHT